MPLDFPSSPTVGTVYDQWQWDGSKWVAIVGTLPAGPTGPAGPGVAAGGTTGQALTKINATDFNTQWTGPYLTGNQSITLSGDISGSGTTAITTTLATVNANVGTFQGLTLDAKGRVTAAANQGYVTGGPYLPTAGGTLSGTLTLSNNLGLYAKLTGGAAQHMISLASDNNFYVGDAVAGRNVNVQNQLIASNSLLVTGPLTASNLTMAAGGVTYYNGVTSGTPAFSANNTNFTWQMGTGNGSWFWLNNAGATAFQVSSAGVFTASGPGTITTTNNTTLTLTNTSGSGYAQLNMNNPTRSWNVGIEPVGNCFIYDNTAAAMRLSISTSGACSCAGGSWTAISDGALKENVVSYERGLEAITKLRPVTFVYAAGTPFADDAGTPRIGLVAQEADAVVPEIVSEVKTENFGTVLATEPGNLVYALINSCRELAELVQGLTERIAALEAGR